MELELITGNAGFEPQIFFIVRKCLFITFTIFIVIISLIFSVIISLSSVKSQSVSLGDAFITSNIAVLLTNRYLIVVVDFDEISSKLTIKSSKLPATDLVSFLKGWIDCNSDSALTAYGAVKNAKNYIFFLFFFPTLTILWICY
jgi:hypothetical protein